ncbi:hypothetical protein D3Y59_07315 [Hymenobacter oligotrophus]|uniref:Uncharacterized protein n=2 Tax=Hymenobacter oligotrophus TaxID=2319843 RepID=A0A3B7R0K7_9BACT|nr:hypothetical protein D3Y59_07315 [Hymenobacter oligotrophus]
MSGPADAAFYRGIDINGTAVTLDGNKWEASAGAANVQVTGTNFSNTSTALSPATDATRAGMLQTAVGGSSVGTTLSGVPAGTYSVYAYIWEDNSAETTNIVLNGQTVKANHNTGGAGKWERVGPFKIEVSNGSIALSTSGGHPNLSGVEVWKHNTTTTAPAPTAPAVTRTLFRAINLNGPAQTIDGISYEDGTTFKDITTNGGKISTQSVTLNPATDAARAQMIRSFVWSNSLSLKVNNVPNGTYEVSYYVFEDNYAQTYSTTLNGQPSLTNYNSGTAGKWQKTAPQKVTVTNGVIELRSTGGAINVSGMEIYRITQ